MRSLMTLASLLMVGTGIFCIANASVAFASVAFVVGVVFVVVGVVEIVLSKKTTISADKGNNDVLIGGLILLVIGIAILLGALNEDITITALFALLIAREGFIDIVDTVEKNVEFADNSIEENLMIFLGGLEAILGVYMFFNKMTLNIQTLLLVGIAIIFMGIRRFQLALNIQYTKPGYLTSAQERLAEAEREDKLAMAKAKEGIRESKEAQKRIKKIKEEMYRERMAINDTTVRAALEKEEKENN